MKDSPSLSCQFEISIVNNSGNIWEIVKKSVPTNPSLHGTILGALLFFMSIYQCTLELVNEEFVIAIKMLDYAISFVFNTTTKY